MKAFETMLNHLNSTHIVHAVKAATAFIILNLSTAVYSQSFVPSQQQIQQFKNLPRAQQEQLAKQMGFDISMLQGSSATANAVAPSNNNEVVERKVDEKQVSKELSRQSVAETKSTSLKPFGYDLFDEDRVSAVTPANIPVPNDYIMGPGDSVNLQLYGKETGSYDLMVNNEGNVDIPELGPLSLAGISYNEAKKLIAQKYKQQKIGVQAFITMGHLKTIQVFLVGEVYRPGTLTLNSLSTVTTALFNSGGVSNIGSLRNIQVKRNGKTVAKFDLYDLIIYGNNGNDIRLQQGDVLFVPTVSKIVSVSGEVRRPAIYELVESETFNDVLKLAGGLLPNADSSSIQLVRNDFVEGLKILSIDSSKNDPKQTELVNGDFISVTKANLEFTNAIRVMGAINSPQLVSLSQNPKLSSIVKKTSVLNNTDLNYGLIVRRAKLDQFTTIIQFSPSKLIDGTFDTDMKSLDEVLLFNRVSNNTGSALEEKIVTGNVKSSEENIKTNEAEFVEQNELEAFTTKQISIYSFVRFSRKQLLAPVIARLKSEASDSHPVQLIEVVGQVKFPGVYPVAQNSSLSNALRAAGGLTESAHLQNAEISSLTIEAGASDMVHRQVNLKTQLSLPEENQISLTSKDVLNVVRIPDWYENDVVTLSGEVTFPGTYQISNGETLSSLIVRAGGLTEKANSEAAIFTRDELKQKEMRNINKSVEDLRQELASNSLSSSQFSKTVDYENAKKILDELTSVKPVGRLVIDLHSILNQEVSNDLELKNGDRLFVPNITPAVSIIGEVFMPSTHWFDEGATLDDYLSKAGGIKEYGDASNLYVIKADGSVLIPESSFWFTANNKSLLSPGDTIVVPRDVTNYENLSLWQSVTQIIYQSAVAVAAIRVL
ncbi:MAG: polysaccharide export outer membrane protein [Glaciecola sp.]|jgi:polysaccharide export outer membrane protein